MKRILVYTVAAMAVAAAASTYAGFAAADAQDPMSPRGAANPAEGAVRSLTNDGAELVVADPSADICIATRAGRAAGSACTSADSTDVMVTYTVSSDGVALGVFDPQQRAASITLDGARVDISTDQGLGFFTAHGPELPERLVVLDSDGEEIASFTPAASYAEDLERAAEESGHGG